MAIDFTLNQQRSSYRGDPSMPLLWYLRDHARLTGTKFGCGIGYCGACTVHIDGAATRSCITPMSQVAGRAVITIEGLARGGRLHPVQQAWIPRLPLLRMAAAPDVAVHLVASEFPPSGAGEMGMPTVAPALVNGIFAASGKRIRRLPVGDQLKGSTARS